MSDNIFVTDVKALEDYKLLVTFSTGEKKIYDVTEQVMSRISYAPMRYCPELFEKVFLDHEDLISWALPDTDVKDRERLLKIPCSYKVSLATEYVYEYSEPYNGKNHIE